MNIAVVKYNAGNIQSLSFALERMQVQFQVTDDPEYLSSADKVIFPGVGEASTTMAYLKQHKLDQVIVSLKQPVLGICLGMQLMCTYSEENNTACMGIFKETVRSFVPTGDMKVPHMGWNTLTGTNSWLSRELEQSYAYFVHSFYVPVNLHTSATTEYIQPFSAAMQMKNFYAVQFHPEKSADAGQIVLQNFLDI